MDEIKKDQLSLALIKRELTKIYTWQLLYLFIIIPALGYLLWLPSLLFFNTAFYPIYIRIVIVLLILLFIYLFTGTIYNLYKVKNERFTIRKAILYKKTDPHSTFSFGNESYYRLHFDRGGYYNIDNDRIYYKWSSLNAMNGRDLFTSSHEDNVFTLIIVEKRPVFVFNDNFFDPSLLNRLD